MSGIVPSGKIKICTQPEASFYTGCERRETLTSHISVNSEFHNVRLSCISFHGFTPGFGAAPLFLM